MNIGSLKETLSQVTDIRKLIREAAAEVMSFDNQPFAAAEVWMYSVQSCYTGHLLPLVYVANEVLQVSRTTLGTIFLEAFGFFLCTALPIACQKERSIVDKVRRTILIWKERRVYSVWRNCQLHQILMNGDQYPLYLFGLQCLLIVVVYAFYLPALSLKKSVQKLFEFE